MIAASIVTALASALIFGWPLLCRWSDRHVDTLVDDVLGQEVDWDAAQEWWESQGRSQLR